MPNFLFHFMLKLLKISNSVTNKLEKTNVSIHIFLGELATICVCFLVLFMNELSTYLGFIQTSLNVRSSNN